MAFLCPVRIRRGKKKKSLSGDVEAIQSSSHTFTSLGRITGSASIETLVRVGLEKENGLSPDSKMVVLHDFTPCVDDELQVKKGQIVNILYRENDWVYVISEDSRSEGFIPLSYCTPYNSHLGELALHNFKKKLPRHQNSNDANDIHKGHISGSENCVKKIRNQNEQQQQGSSEKSHGSTSPADMNHFLKDPSGRFIVLYSFVARDENDVSVERGDFVTVLNREDSDWYWIVRSDGQEGFVPSGFVYPADVLQKMTSNLASTSSNNTTSNMNSPSNPTANTMPVNPVVSNFNEEGCFHGTELVMLYDYKAQASDDLSIRRGDWIYADLSNQTVDGWLWVYAPKTKKYGFVPKVYARPPAMTIQIPTNK